MPTIRLPKKQKYNTYKFKNSNKKNNLIHKYVYNTKRWKLLRINHLSKNPLCEICFKNEKIVSAEDVHHIIPISRAGNDIVMIKKLGFDKNNLMSVCKKCHKILHNTIQ